MADSSRSKTMENLKLAFLGEAQANQRYRFFANKADTNTYPEVSKVYRDIAERNAGHAFENLEFIEQMNYSEVEKPINETKGNLSGVIAGEANEFIEQYPGFAKTAREEGFIEIAEWFETLAKAEKSHIIKFQKLLKSI